MKLYLYYGEYTAKQDVENIADRLKERSHIICDSFSDCDLILSLGGDGTLLKAAQHAIRYDKPLAGINCGRLGYLCLLKQEELAGFDKALAEATISEKTLLKCQMDGVDYYAVNDIAAGKTINAILFCLVAPHATNAKVWVASSLPSSIDASHTLQYVDVPASALGNEQIDIQLPTPCEIPASGIYVGYSFTITSATTSNDAYPVLFGGEPAINTLILKTEKNVPDWSDLYSNGFGRLFLQVLLEGTFAENNATVADFGPVYSVLGESTTAMIAVTNGGGTPLSSIDYTITTDGVTGAEQHADIANPIAFSNTEYH